MKSILLHVHEDSGMGHRLQIALDLARQFGAHLTCLQVHPPVPNGNVAAIDGIYVPGILVETRSANDEITRSRIEAQLAIEDVAWTWRSADGDIVGEIVRAAALADLVILGQCRPASASETGLSPLAIIEDVAVAVDCAVLVVPQDCVGIDAGKPIVVGWNGSPQAARAIRQAIPLICQSKSVHIVSVGEDPNIFPQTAPAEYCAKYGIKSELHVVPGNIKRADKALSDLARQVGAGAIVIGAFGRSRLREAVLGGTTHGLLSQSRIPLILGH